MRAGGPRCCSSTMSPTSVRYSTTSRRMRLTWRTGTASQSASRAPQASTSTTGSSKHEARRRDYGFGGGCRLGDRTHRQRHVADVDVVGAELEPRPAPLAPLVAYRPE